MSTASKNITRESIVTAALAELDEHGLDGLTLRGVAARLDAKAPALYWHVKNKQAILDEIGTELWRPAIEATITLPSEATWRETANTFARTLRAAFLAHRDGARAASGAYITDTALLTSMEEPLGRLVGHGHDVAEIVDLIQVVQHATVGFCIDEQVRAEQDGRYDLDQRAERLRQAPLVIQAGPSLVGDADARFDRMLAILLGAGDARLAP